MSFNPAEQGQQQSGQQAYQGAPGQQHGQYPPWQPGQHGQQGQQPHGQPAYRAPELARRSPVSSATLSTWLLLGTVVAGLLAWLLSLFGSPAVSIDFSLGAGLLGLVVLLPGEDKAPKLLPFVAVFATLAGLLGIRAVVGAGFGVPSAIGVVVFVLIVLEMLAAIGAVLFEYNMVQLPAPGTAGPSQKAGRAPRSQRQSSQQAQPQPAQPYAGRAEHGQPQPGQPYPGRAEQGQPQQGQPQQAAPAQPVWMAPSAQPGYQPQPQAGVVGNFDPSQFESGAFQPAGGKPPAEAPVDPSRAPQPPDDQQAGEQATAQQTPPQQAVAQQTPPQQQDDQSTSTQQPGAQGTKQFNPLDRNG